MRAVLLALALTAPLPALAQDAPAAPQTVEVRLSSFSFDPRAIALTAGRPVTLHLVNTGGGGHNFSAPQFFAAAHLAQGWSSAAVIAVFGLGFQFLALVTGSLLLPVILHFLYDVATGLYLSGRRDVENV